MAADKGSDEKYILDVCCGGRMFWFNKNHPNTIYCDIRQVEPTVIERSLFSVQPDVVADFRHLPFPNDRFLHVIFDPPHLKYINENSTVENSLAAKYGRLFPTWEDDIAKGFNECMRVLKPGGTLILKWNEAQISSSKIVKVIGQEPLYGHRTGANAKTIWMAFMKSPSK